MKYYLSIDSVISRIENQTGACTQAEYLRLKSHIKRNRKIWNNDDFTKIRIGLSLFSVWTGKKLL